MQVNADVDRYLKIKEDFPELNGKECLGVVTHNQDEVLYVKHIHKKDRTIAVVANKKGALRLTTGCRLVPLMYSGEGSYSLRAYSTQEGFSLKGGGKLYHDIKMAVNYDSYGNMVFKRLDAINRYQDKEIISKSVAHRGSYLLFDKLEIAYIRKKQKQKIQKWKSQQWVHPNAKLKGTI